MKTLDTIVVPLLAGSLFGFGLALSDMMNPARVLAFLHVTGDWDATLLFVMLGALLIAVPAFQLILRRQRPLLAQRFRLPGKQGIDTRLLIGAALFGTGWGLIGLCPGPALAGLVLAVGEVWVFVIAMFIGFYLAGIKPR